jgi:hypothetical protein
VYEARNIIVIVIGYRQSIKQVCRLRLDLSA